jgi:putative tricarboxylic transport membrane protein
MEVPLTARIQKAVRAGLAVALLTFWPQLLPAERTFGKLTILVPAERSGGWDLTARAMAKVLQQTGGAEKVEIEYSPGAGGLIGLAQFISSRREQGDALLIGGMFTVGAVVQNRSTVSLLQTTPLARLAFDQAVVAVPATSRIKTAEDLIEAMLAAPGSVSWVGGSRAGVDEMNLLEIARALGIPSARLHYAGLPGGGEVGEALASGRYDVGISGHSEFEELVAAGRLRMIAVTTEDDVSDIDVPSFEKLGISIEHFNWRGVFAPPGISDSQREALAFVIERMVQSDAWQQQLLKHHWQDAYLPGDEFVEFIRREQGQVEAALDSMKEADPAGQDIVNKVLARRYFWALALALLSALLVFILFFQRAKAHLREEGLQHAFEEATGEAILRTEELEKALAGIHAQIEQEFDAWNLTVAEREVALLLLKGLRLKEIADARGTSERTVRQQAQAVYKKAGLEGRSELAAFFIEDFMQSMDLNARQSGK